MQNKLHYAVTHHTAAEIVYGRADSTKPNMGLTTWKNAPKGRIRKSDVTVAKNYLNETEMRNLNEIVTMYLDYTALLSVTQAPGFAEGHDWQDFLFLTVAHL